MMVSLTVGKVDAGVAVLLTEDKRLIEFPSILLPPNISSGSIVDVNVSRNISAETTAQKAFTLLQAQVLSAFGEQAPEPPVLRCRNATQTSIVLEWDPVILASAELRSLSLHRNGTKAGTIPRPREMTSTKISGLAVDTEYSFQLVLRTSAGAFSSERLVVRTHKMTDLSGITITAGVIARELRDSLHDTIERIGARLVDPVRIDTTHFVCTEEGGAGWERARDMNIPIVTPDWVKGCEREGRLVGVRGYYLNADPKLRQVGPGMIGMQRQESGQGQFSQRSRIERQASTAESPVRTRDIPRTEITPPTPEVTQKPFSTSDRTQPQEPVLEPTPESTEPPPPVPLAKDESTTENEQVPIEMTEEAQHDEPSESRADGGDATEVTLNTRRMSGETVIVNQAIAGESLPYREINTHEVSDNNEYSGATSAAVEIREATGSAEHEDVEANTTDSLPTVEDDLIAGRKVNVSGTEEVFNTEEEFNEVKL